MTVYYTGATAIPSKMNVWRLTFARAVLLFSLVSISLPGCMRYVASKEELDKKYATNLAGEREFEDYEKALQNRLEQLIASREFLLHGDNTGGYKIGPGDVVSVTVYGFPDLKTDTSVSSAGTLSLPLVGEERLAGLNLLQARENLTQRYGKFVRNPKVEVALKTYQANRVSVTGEVAKPGMYPLTEPGQLLNDVLSSAGGRTDRASSRIILLPAPKRGSESEGDIGVEIDTERLTGQINQRPLLIPLMPGDTIIVPEAGTFEVDGEIEKPGSYKLASRTSVVGAVAAAGGFTYAANVNKVELIRDVGNGKKAFVNLDLEEVGLRGGQDIRLRDGDFIRVPSEPGRFFRRQVVEALNGVFRGVGVNGRVP